MRIRTLLIDDDEPSLRLVSLIARERGHEVIVLSNPDASLPSPTDSDSPKENASCDLLITGDLPQLSGLDIIERRAKEGERSIQGKAVLSRTWTPENLARARRLGCKAFKKPFLVREINDWLEEQELEIALRPPSDD